MSISISTPKVSTQVEFFKAAKEEATSHRHIIEGRGIATVEAYIERAMFVKRMDTYFKEHKQELKAQNINAAEFKERCGIDKSVWSQDVGKQGLATLHTPDKFDAWVCERYADEDKDAGKKITRKDYLRFLKGDKPEVVKDHSDTARVSVEGGKTVTVIISEQPKAVQKWLLAQAEAQAEA